MAASLAQFVQMIAAYKKYTFLEILVAGLKKFKSV